MDPSGLSGDGEEEEEGEDGDEAERKNDTSTSRRDYGVRPSRKQKNAPPSSLELLEGCLPRAPSRPTGHGALEFRWPRLNTQEVGSSPTDAVMKAFIRHTTGDSSDAANGATGGKGTPVVPLLARIPALDRRMRSLLGRCLYGHGSQSDDREQGRPSGFVGARLAEETCLAIFARIGALRAKGVGKQVRVTFFIDACVTS